MSNSIDQRYQRLRGRLYGAWGEKRQWRTPRIYLLYSAMPKRRPHKLAPRPPNQPQLDYESWFAQQYPASVVRRRRKALLHLQKVMIRSFKKSIRAFKRRAKNTL